MRRRAAIALLAAWPVQAARSAPAAYREIAWEDLVPKEWDPLKRFRDLKLDSMSDSNPKVLQLMRDMRATGDNAPTNRQMNGAAGKLAGYIVPLEAIQGELKEFLLVPYFGACIHSPPPPANQIVHVVLDKPAKGFRTMDAVWAGGTLKTLRQDSWVGMSGYRMQAALLEPYVPKPRP